jgi:hypothetical protein
MVLAADVLHNIHGTRDLALVWKRNRRIQNGLLGLVRALDLDNLAQCRLAPVIPARGIETGPITGYPEQSLSSHLIGCHENVTVVVANREELRIKGE